MPTDTWARLAPSRRSAVVRAAEAEFAEHGFSHGSLNVVAREAGIAKGSLFQYFDDKADLFTHLVDLAADRVGAAMEERVESLDWSAGFFPALGVLLDAWVEHFLTHPVDRALCAAVNLEPDPEARTAVRGVIDDRLLAFLGPLLAAARDDGWLRRDADLDAFLSLLLMVLSHLALAPSNPELDPVLGLGTDPGAGAGRLLGVFEAAFGGAREEAVAPAAPGGGRRRG